MNRLNKKLEQLIIGTLKGFTFISLYYHLGMNNDTRFLLARLGGFDNELETLGVLGFLITIPICLFAYQFKDMDFEKRWWWFIFFISISLIVLSYIGYQAQLWLDINSSLGIESLFVYKVNHNNPIKLFYIPISSHAVALITLVTLKEIEIIEEFVYLWNHRGGEN